MKTTLPAWWNYVKHIVEEYPDLHEELQSLKSGHITAQYGERIRNKGNICRPVEMAACKRLAPNKQRKYDAVREAIHFTKREYPETCENRLKIIEMVYFQKKYNITGAALSIPCHMNTASRWQADFLRQVAEILQLP